MFKKKPEGPKNIEVKKYRDYDFLEPGLRQKYLDWGEEDGFYLQDATQAAPKKPETFRCEYCGAPKLKRTCAYCGSK